MPDFKIGDKVVHKVTFWEGYIVDVDDTEESIYVEFINEFGEEDGMWWAFCDTDFIEKKVKPPYHYCNPLCIKCMKEPRKAVEF